MALRRVEKQGLVWYRFTGPGPELAHAMVTRQGGSSRGPFAALNFGGTVGDEPERVADNHRRLYEALSVTPEAVVSPYQVHGNRVALVHESDGGSVIPETDGLITDTPGVVLLLRFADCVPVLFYDPAHHAAGLAHAGWRGVAAGIAPATVKAMAEAFGTRPQDLWAGVGPAIGPDHYAVGEEVVEAVTRTLRGHVPVAAQREGQWYLDLPGAVRAQLQQASVGTVDLAGICTACNTGAWFSHRAESGKTGRFGVTAMLT
jgi:hypothetical protein